MIYSTFMPGRRNFPIILTGICCLMIGMMVGAGWAFATKPRVPVELVPVKVVGKCSVGYATARVVEIKDTKQRCYVKGVLGNVGEEFNIDPDYLIDYRPSLPPKEVK